MAQLISLTVTKKGNSTVSGTYLFNTDRMFNVSTGSDSCVFSYTETAHKTVKWTVEESGDSVINSRGNYDAGTSANITFTKDGNITLTTAKTYNVSVGEIVYVVTASGGANIFFDKGTNILYRMTTSSSVAAILALINGQDVDVGDDLNVTGDLAVTGNSTCAGNSTVTGNSTVSGNSSVTGRMTVVADGTVAEPAVKIGTAENGLYELTATQLGASIGNTLVATIEDDGIHPDAVFLRVGVGTANTGVTAQHYGDGRNIITVLTFSALALPAITAAADEAHGYLLYTFPAGTHYHEVTYMDVALQGGGTIDADTPDVGIGSVIGAGAVAVLDTPATFEDYITGQTATDCGGTATKKLTAATAGIGTGISLNSASDVKTVYLNYADGWAGADTIAATGTVILKWSIMS